jgi:hypothetical protein
MGGAGKVITAFRVMALIRPAKVAVIYKFNKSIGHVGGRQFLNDS